MAVGFRSNPVAAVAPNQGSRLMLRVFGPFLLVLPARHSSAYLRTVGNNQAILGQVTDPIGAPIPGATVTIRSRETRMQRSIQSDQEGRFSFPQLKPRAYAVKAEGQDSISSRMTVSSPDPVNGRRTSHSE